MTRKRIAIIIAAAALTVGAGLAANEYASAQGWGGGPGFHRGGPTMRGHMMGGMMGGHMMSGPIISRALAMKDELKLTADQVKKLEQLRDGFYQKAARERIEMQSTGLELQKLHLADKLDVAAAERLIRAMEKKRADMRIERLKTIEQGKAILTSEQLKQLQAASFGPGVRMGRGGSGPGQGFGPGRGAGMMGPGFGPGPAWEDAQLPGGGSLE